MNERPIEAATAVEVRPTKRLVFLDYRILFEWASRRPPNDGAPNFLVGPTHVGCISSSLFTASTWPGGIGSIAWKCRIWRWRYKGSKL